MNDQAKPWFVLGAGFNVSAASEAWASQNNSQPGLAYPLVSDLWEICFPGKPRQLDRSIEEAFAEALRSANQQPVLDLCQHLFRCDYYIAGALRDGQNCYRDFLQRFHGSDFLTYNYDSLVEILLVRLGAWSPVDGYGITVQVGRDPVAIPPPVGRSLSKVFHLHGSLVLHTETATYTRSERGRLHGGTNLLPLVSTSTRVASGAFSGPTRQPGERLVSAGPNGLRLPCRTSPNS